jgi:hypothetical protein
MTDERAPMNDERAAMVADMRADESVLDGNAIAGLLAATFGSDMTAMPGRCAHCDTISIVADFRAYTRAPGTVLRCPICSSVVLRVVETPTATLVDLSGIASLRIPRS